MLFSGYLSSFPLVALKGRKIYHFTAQGFPTDG